jgi:3-oxoacyl-[acyl-carrier-protein] synthase-3
MGNVWDISRTGLLYTRVPRNGQRLQDMAVKAVLGLPTIPKIDATIYCGVCRDQTEPSIAHSILKKLGAAGDAKFEQIRDVHTAFDVSSACAGVGMALRVSHMMLESPEHNNINNILIVASEDSLPSMSDFMNTVERSLLLKKEYIESHIATLTFGSGAIALVVSDERSDCRIWPRTWGVQPQHADLAVGASYLEAVSIKNKELLHRGLEINRTDNPLRSIDYNSYDFVAMHQVGDAHRVKLSQMHDIDSEKVSNTFADYGNMGAVSAPFTMCKQILNLSDTSPHSGLLYTFGSGFVWNVFDLEISPGFHKDIVIDDVVEEDVDVLSDFSSSLRRFRRLQCSIGKWFT